MSSQSSRPPQINSQPAYTPEDDRAQERWKTSPSTEVTSEQGENAKRTAERRHEENTPGSGDGKNDAGKKDVDR
jgi:hypothetical protein